MNNIDDSSQTKPVNFLTMLNFKIWHTLAYKSYVSYVHALKRVNILFILLITSIFLSFIIDSHNFIGIAMILLEIYVFYSLFVFLRARSIVRTAKTIERNYNYSNLPLYITDYCAFDEASETATVAISFFKERLLISNLINWAINEHESYNFFNHLKSALTFLANFINERKLLIKQIKMNKQTPINVIYVVTLPIDDKELFNKFRDAFNNAGLALTATDDSPFSPTRLTWQRLLISKNYPHKWQLFKVDTIHQ